MTEEIKAPQNEEDPVEKAKNFLITGVIIVVVVAGIFALVLYAHLNNG